MNLIGNTPLIPLFFPDEQRTVWGKCEFLNPSGSIKDRLARTIVLDAESRGELHDGSIILECTSGNTGIAFAMVGAARGYRVTIVMSENASGERRKIIEHFGAQLILFQANGYQRGIERAETKVYAMEPSEAALLAGEEACCHWIEGIAGGFVPPLMRGVPLDGTLKVSSPAALEMTRRLNKEFGLLVGSSSGANVSAAMEVAKNCLKKRSSLPFSATERSDTSARDSLIARIRMLNEKPEIKTSQQSKQQGSKIRVGNLLLAVWSNKDSNSLNHVVKLPSRQGVHDRR